MLSPIWLFYPWFLLALLVHIVFTWVPKYGKIKKNKNTNLEKISSKSTDFKGITFSGASKWVEGTTFGSLKVIKGGTTKVGEVNVKI